jgi:predicted TIM-barrel fold metal-dependent hydrolase
VFAVVAGTKYALSFLFNLGLLNLASDQTDSCAVRCSGIYQNSVWLFDFCAAKPERLLGVAQLSMEDPVAARAELERLARRGGLRHVNILASRANPPVYDERWEPFWALADEAGIPIGFHLAVLVKKTRLDEEDRGAANLVLTAASRFAKEPPGIQLLEPITGLILAGVLDRHPRLKIVMAEAGVAWVPQHDPGSRHPVPAHARRPQTHRR